MDFTFTTGKSGHRDVVLDKHPRDGEPSSYDPEASFASFEAYDLSAAPVEYGVVAFLPNQHGNGNVLIFEGASTTSTKAVMDFVVNDDLLLPALQKIRRPDGSVPYFEMLLACPEHGDGTRPTLVALHDHPVSP